MPQTRGGHAERGAAARRSPLYCARKKIEMEPGFNRDHSRYAIQGRWEPWNPCGMRHAVEICLPHALVAREGVLPCYVELDPTHVV